MENFIIIKKDPYLSLIKKIANLRRSAGLS